VFGVEPICTDLTEGGAQIAPSTYYASKSRPPSRRAVHDEHLKAEIQRVFDANLGVYGVRKVWWQLKREGHQVPRCQARHRRERAERRARGSAAPRRAKTSLSPVGAVCGEPGSGAQSTPRHSRRLDQAVLPATSFCLLPLLISTLRGLACSATDRMRVRTPSSYSAPMFSVSSCSPRNS
jgi:hypothetical protein